MIIWDENKNRELKLGRNISFEQISQIIIDEKYVDILEHPKRRNQLIFVVKLNDYIHAVPFVMIKTTKLYSKQHFRVGNYIRNIEAKNEAGQV